MRAVVQRVTSASVTVGEEVVGKIGRGICVLIGLARDDDQKDIDFMIRKLMNLRIFESSDGKRWDKSVSDFAYEILCVSQFTLMCSLKGNKPDYRHAMSPETAPQFYENFLKQLREAYKPELIKDGRFGAFMQVRIENDGPVTICLDSKKLPQNSDSETS